MSVVPEPPGAMLPVARGFPFRGAGRGRKVVVTRHVGKGDLQSGVALVARRKRVQTPGDTEGPLIGTFSDV